MEISGFGWREGRILKAFGKSSRGAGAFVMGFPSPSLHEWAYEFRCAEEVIWIQLMLFLAVHPQTNYLPS